MRAFERKLFCKINGFEKEKEKLNIESYAKSRALSNPHIFRDEETARTYGRRLKEIEKEIAGLDEKIKVLESQIIGDVPITRKP